MKRRAWSESEMATLQRWHATKTDADIAEMLGRTVRSVRERRVRMGLLRTDQRPVRHHPRGVTCSVCKVDDWTDEGRCRECRRRYKRAYDRGVRVDEPDPMAVWQERYEAAMEGAA